MKKRFLFVMIFILLFSGVFAMNFNSEKVFAESYATSSQYIKRITNVVSRTLSGNVEFKTVGYSTMHNGDDVKNQWLDRDVNTLTAPGDQTAVRVVSWGIDATNGWQAATMTAICQDYQTKHPGTIVLGGVSGDFFDNNTEIYENSQEPLNNWVSEGEVFKKDAHLNDYQQVLGFKEDRTWIAGVPTSTEKPDIKIYGNDDKIIDSIPVAKIIRTDDASLNSSGLNIIYPGFTGSLDTTGYTVLKGTYSSFKESGKKHRYHDEANYGSYLKGRIASVDASGEALTKVNRGEFYILSKDAEVQTKLPVGTNMKCEYTLTNEFAGVNNTMGFIFQLVDNNSTDYFLKYNGPHTYAVNPRARAAIGFKPDNTVVFLTAGAGPLSGSTQPGPSFFELAELLKLEGCTEGFNLDGGGSSSLVVRTENGGFQMVNYPADNGVPRHIGNGLLFVMQNPYIKLTESTDKSLTFEQYRQLTNGTLTMANVVVAGKTYSLLDGPVTISSLNKGSTHNVKYEFSYDYEGNSYYGEIKESVQTDSASEPNFRRFNVTKKSATSVEVDYRISNIDLDSVDKMFINYDGKAYFIEDVEGKVIIDELESGKAYNFELIVKYYAKPGQLKTVISPLVQVIAGGTGGGGGGGCNFGASLIYSIIGALAMGLLIFRRKK